MVPCSVIFGTRLLRLHIYVSDGSQFPSSVKFSSRKLRHPSSGAIIQTSKNESVGQESEFLSEAFGPMREGAPWQYATAGLNQERQKLRPQTGIAICRKCTSRGKASSRKRCSSWLAAKRSSRNSCAAKLQGDG